MKCEKCGTEYDGNECPVCNSGGVGESTETMDIKGESDETMEGEGESVKTEELKGEEKKSSDSSKKNLRMLGIAEGITALLLIVSLAMWMNLSSENNKIKREYSSITSDYNKLKNDYASVKDEYQQYKNKMQPYEELDEAEAEARKIEAQKVAEQKKAEEEKAAADAAAAKAAEEAKGYETGITYDQLARTPDDYKGKKVKFTGKVIQVIEGSGSVQIRLAVDDNYDTIILGEYSSDIVASRVLEDDHITIYGTSVGTISYQSTMGGNITIPGISIERIDQ